MSINVFKAAGVNLAEQAGEREETPHAGDGRLDVMTCTFMDAQGAFSNGAHRNLRQFFEDKFRPYSQHPDAANSPGLRAMYLMPGSVVGRPSWNGLARIAATYIGMFDRTKLPDAFIEATSAESIQVASQDLAIATMNYDVNYITSVDHNELRTPECSRIVNNLYRIEGISQGRDPSNKTIQALAKTSVVARHGPYTVLRHEFVPMFVAALNLQWVISNNRVINATKVPATIPTFFDGTENVKLIPKTKVVRMDECRPGNSFLNRLGGGD